MKIKVIHQTHSQRKSKNLGINKRKQQLIRRKTSNENRLELLLDIGNIDTWWFVMVRYERYNIEVL